MTREEIRQRFRAVVTRAMAKPPKYVAPIKTRYKLADVRTPERTR